MLFAYVNPAGATLSFVAVLLLCYAWINVKAGIANDTPPSRILTQLGAMMLPAILLLVWFGAWSLGFFL